MALKAAFVPSLWVKVPLTLPVTAVRVTLKLAQPLLCDPYAESRATGAFIVIDESTNNTVGAGMIA